MYSREKIIKLTIRKELLDTAKAYARSLGIENKGLRTRDGGSEKDIKGSIAQILVHEYLESLRIPHEYSSPYTKGQHGDPYDILFSDMVIDVKCRGKWSEKYFYNIKLLMAEHELTEAKPCDYYVFCTLDEDFSNLYILGVLSYRETWGNLKPLSPEEKKVLLFPAKGFIYSRSLAPFSDLFM